MRPLFDSQYFDLEQVAAGVYAAIVRLAGGGASNAGFVDLGDRVLVVDTFRHPRAAHDLRTAAEQLTRHPVAYVVNTHYHAERVLGNPVFADATIIATARIREGIAAETGEFITWAQVPGHVDEFLAAGLRKPRPPPTRGSAHGSKPGWPGTAHWGRQYPRCT